MEMENQDFISELPDEILHHIFSFLDMVFIVRTSILSKKWRYIWRSTHFLNFNEELFNTPTEEEEPVQKGPFILDASSKDHFMDFVNRVLFLHCKSNINTFSFSGVDPRLVTRLWTWMKYNPWLPIRRDAQESENRRTLDLHLCFFNSNTLTTLKLDMGSKKGRQIFKIPDLSLLGSLPCLKTLHLGSVLLVDGDSISSFLSMCLVLETLVISNCLLEERNNLSINGLQLKYLELGISCVKSTFIGDNNGKITVFAPNLTSFKCRDLLLSEFYFDLENVSALLDADLDACTASRPKCLFPFRSEYSSQREEEYIHNVLKCLRNVCNVKSLYMCPLENVLGVRSGFEDLLNPFGNLRVLKLKTMFSKKHILRIAVLEMCPHVETLILERTSGMIVRPVDWSGSISIDQRIEPWEMKAPFHCLSYNLKFLEVRGAYGTFDEFKFLRFLLRNAMVLVKLVIFTCESNSHHSSEECLQRFSEKLGAVFLHHDLSHYICVGEVLQPWEMKAPLHYLSYSLKYLEIRGVYETADEFMILRFLLKNIAVLVKMVIFTFACDESSVERCTEGCIERFREKLVELPKASPNVEISFSNSTE